MIAFVLRETGRDPAWLIGAPVPQLGANAGAGEGWLVVEGDESDRSVFGLPAEIAVVTNVELDHHTEFASLAELEARVRRVDRARAATVVRDAPPYEGALRRAGRAQPAATRARRSRRSSSAGVARAEAEPVLARFTGTGRRFEVSEAGGVTIVDDYGHHPTELAATIAAVREAYPGRRLRVLFQPHLYSRTRHLGARARRRARGGRRRRGDGRLPGPRGAGPGRDRQARRGRAVRSRPARGVDADAWSRASPTSRAGPSRATSLLTIGAGDIDRRAGVAARGARVSSRRG